MCRKINQNENEKWLSEKVSTSQQQAVQGSTYQPKSALVSKSQHKSAPVSARQHKATQVSNSQQRCSPRPAEIDKTRRAQRGKAGCRSHRLFPHIWTKSGEVKEKLFIWSFVQIVMIWFADHFKEKECNFFHGQNTILLFFAPLRLRPPRGFSSSPRSTPRW